MLRPLPYLSFSLLLSLLLLSYCQAHAQRGRQQDVVFLKNGGIIRGEIREITDDFTVKIETVGRNLFVYKREEVDRISREREAKNASFQLKEKGYVNMTEIGVLTGRSGGTDQFNQGFYHNTVTLQTFNGYQFWPTLQVGLTAGVDWYQAFPLVPVALGLRGELSQSKVTPFYSLDVGHGFDWLNTVYVNQRARGGMMWNPGIGLKVRGTSTAWVISLGYKSQSASTFFNTAWQRTEQDIHYNRLALRTGISF
jgi:sRNA-binding regulator protein Hfq